MGLLSNEQLDVLEPEGVLGGVGTALAVFDWPEEEEEGFKGESIGHGRTGNPQGCPVVAMRCRVAYLRRHDATVETKGTKCQDIKGDDITAAIRAIVQAAGPSIAFHRGGHQRTFPPCRGVGNVSPHGVCGPRYHPPGVEVAEDCVDPPPPHQADVVWVHTRHEERHSLPPCTEGMCSYVHLSEKRSTGLLLGQ